MRYRDIAMGKLKADEGKVPWAYQDSEGYWTIGVGRLIDKRKGGRLRDDEMALMLENDVRDAEADARFLFKDFEYLTDNRKAVLICMAFQIGRSRLAGFQKTISAVGRGDFADAAVCMLDSLWAKQTPERAQRLANMMREG